MTTASLERTTPSIGWRGRLALVGIVLVVSAVGCELLARLLYPRPPLPGRAPQLQFQIHPQVGFLHLPNHQGYLDDGLATINALGLRGEMPVVPKPTGHLRILAVGDSTTFGWGVDDDDTYVVQLERLLEAAFPGRSLDVVNAGVANYNLRREFELLEHLGPTLEPDVVLVGAYWNDLPYNRLMPDDEPPFDLGRTERDADLERAAGTPGRTFSFSNERSRFNRLLRSSRALYVLRHAWLAMTAPTDEANATLRWELALLEGRDTPAVEAAWQDVRATLFRFRRLADERGYDIGLVIPPIRAQVEGDHPNAAYQSRLQVIAEELDMFVVDPLPAFRAAGEPGRLFIPFDRIHFTGEGNAVVARAAFDVLRSRRPFQSTE